MPIDVVGWGDDAVSGVEDIVTGDDYTSLGDEFVSGADEDVRQLLSAGDEFVSGEELALSGASIPQARMMSMAKRLAARAVARKGAVAVKSRGATAARRFPLGLSGQFTVTSTGTLDQIIQANPQIPFRGERLTLPSVMGVARAQNGATFGSTSQTVTASDFVVTDVKIGNRSQLVAAGGIPGQVFAESGFGVALRLDTAQVAQNVIVQASYVGALGNVTLVGSQSFLVPFRAAVLGTAIY